MTDKTIIDGVDVSGCKDRYRGTNCNNTGASCPYIECQNNSICYYKQLKRKEQECESLKEENTVLKMYKGSKQAAYEDMQQKGNKAINENRRLRETELKELKEITKKYFCIIGDLNYKLGVLDAQIAKLEKENKELKENLKIQKSLYTINTTRSAWL